MSLQDITGRELADALLAAGWQLVGRRTGLYERLAIVASDGATRRHTLTVPLDESKADYEDLMGAACDTLERLFFDGRAARVALTRIAPDVYR